MDTLKPCKYRGNTKDEKRFYCICHKLFHTGTVSLEICLSCPFCTDIDNEYEEELLLLMDRLIKPNAPQRICTPCCGNNI